MKRFLLGRMKEKEKETVLGSQTGPEGNRPGQADLPGSLLHLELEVLTPLRLSRPSPRLPG